jgi:diguanylate cyclase (GGDEF)-like protein
LDQHLFSWSTRAFDMAKVTRRSAGQAGHSTRRTRLIGLSSTKSSAAAARATGGPDRTKGKTPRAGRTGTSAAAAIAALTKRLAQARRRIAKLEAHADTDFLLDIPNRRGFVRELNRSIAFVKRYRVSAALLVVDVDRLKPINDRFGHAAGDQLLKAIVAALAANIRQSDMLGRLGGDEFGILLWKLGEKEALAKAVALERAVGGTACEYRGRRLPAGVSIGVTALAGDDEAARVLERADQAMYARKVSRRGSGRSKSAVKR